MHAIQINMHTINNVATNKFCHTKTLSIASVDVQNKTAIHKILSNILIVLFTISHRVLLLYNNHPYKSHYNLSNYLTHLSRCQEESIYYLLKLIFQHHY